MDLLRDIAPHVIHIEWFIKRRNSPHGFIKQSHRWHKQIAEDARNRHHDIDAWTPQLFQRDYLDFSRAIQRITNRAHTE